MLGADEIEYERLEDDLVAQLALQTDEPFIATSALCEIARRIPSRGRDIAEAILRRPPWDDYLTGYAVEILFDRDPEAARREMSRLVQEPLHPTVLESMAESVVMNPEQFEDEAGRALVERIAAGLLQANVKSFENGEVTGTFLRRHANGSLPRAFILLGKDGDESRRLVHGPSGFAMTIPGRPWFSDDDVGPRKADILIRLRDLKVVIGVRLENLTSDVHGIAPTRANSEPIAAMLVHEHAKQRATEHSLIGLVRGDAIVAGVDACAFCDYSTGDDPASSMEYASVSVCAHANGVWALYQSVRYSRSDLTEAQWAGLRGVLQDSQTWDGRGHS